MVLILALSSRCLAEQVLLYEDFESVAEWTGPYGGGSDYASLTNENGKAIMRLDRPQATDPENMYGWYAGWMTDTKFSFGANTLEFKLDLVAASENDAFTVLVVNEFGALCGYLFGLDRNEVFLSKYGDKGGSWFTSYFYGRPHFVTKTNLTLAVAFTRSDTELSIRSRILDRDNANAVLWEHFDHDTAGGDSVMPNRAWKYLHMDPEGYAPPVDGTLEVGIGIVYLNTAKSPAQPLEITVDNYRVSQYPAAASDILHSVMLYWPEDTVEEQIVVSADSAESTIWTPWHEPCYRHDGKVCMATPTVATQQYFKLVSGTQFIDDFEAAKLPFSGKLLWEPGFYNPTDANRWEITNANGTLRVHTLVPPAEGQVPIRLPRLPDTDLAFKDFCASVDILQFDGTNSYASVGIGARITGQPNDPWPGTRNGFLAFVRPNAGGLNQARLVFFNGSGDFQSDPFTFRPGTPYRLIFSGVGTQLTVELIDLETQQPAVTPLVRVDPTFTQGTLGLWARSGVSATLDTTLDNFFVTGTKP